MKTSPKLAVIQVTIEAGPAVGKSAVAFALAKLCKDNGIAVKIAGLELHDDIPGTMERQWPVRLKSLAGTRLVRIRTVSSVAK